APCPTSPSGNAQAAIGRLHTSDAALSPLISGVSELPGVKLMGNLCDICDVGFFLLFHLFAE
uniref:Uncharacterized protein n=1 Tax=Denticeps clupeoides TaxID=299321 RepID=A0AAY4AGQ1_9TELE